MVLIRELAVATLLLLAGGADAFYPKSGPVLEVDHRSFKKEVLQSEHAVMVEFFAPWCGHCQNLKPAYEKAAKSLKGLAKVVAIDCDNDDNRPTCAQYGVQGFPTLKTFKPTTKKGKPVVEDYQGPRTAKGIVDALIEKIPNHVTRLTAGKLDGFLATKNESAKAILFTTKGTSPPLWKSLAIDFLGSIEFAQVRDKETAAVDSFGVAEFPTVVVLPGGDAPGVVYEGKMEKDALVKFLETIKPRAKAAEEKEQPELKKKNEKKSDKPSSGSGSGSSSSASSQAPAHSEKPKPELRTLSPAALTQECFAPKSKTCVLIAGSAPGAEEAHEKLAARPPPHTFRFFRLEAPEGVLGRLGLDGEKALVAVNAHRGWWRKFEADVEAASEEDVLSWLDAVKMGEGKKEKLPEGMVVEAEEEEAKETKETKEEKEEKIEEEKEKVEEEKEAAEEKVEQQKEAAEEKIKEDKATAEDKVEETTKAEAEAEEPGHDEL